MTSAIQVGSKIQSAMAGPARAAQSHGTDFADLMNFVMDKNGINGVRTVAAIDPSQLSALGAGPTNLAASSLEAMLAQLAETLAGFAANLENGVAPTGEQLEELAALLDDIEGLLGDTALPGPDHPFFGQLQALLERLGIETTPGASGPIDGLSGLASKLAGQLRSQSPDIAGQLTALVKQLDGHAAQIEAEAKNAEPDAQMRRHLIASEIKPDANAAIANADQSKGLKLGQATGESRATDAAQNLIAPANASKPQATGPQADMGQQQGQSGTNPLAAAQAALAAGASESADMPDGLTITPGTPATNLQAALGAKQANPAAAAYARPEPQVNMPFVAAEIARHVHNGINRFEIRMNPPELGRIDVRIEFDQSGNVTARLAVERSETLDLMQRDQRALEKALAEAGLDGETDLEFSLQQDDASDHAEGGESREWRAEAAVPPSEAEQNLQVAQSPTLYRGYARLDAVNLWV
ncbi:flagellar hook-length control protein FliK [Pelagibacterium lentulum]|nr:flagellar hook-length control protein FliK [Pelagibacterium lentulum]